MQVVTSEKAYIGENNKQGAQLGAPFTLLIATVGAKIGGNTNNTTTCGALF